MSATLNPLNVAGSIGGVAQSVGNLAGDIGNWLTALSPASYGGVPFGVESGRTAAGRKTVTHTYPFRDDVWIEDLGKRGRTFDVQGFLVDNDLVTGATSAQAVYKNLLSISETAGGQTLVHPTLGTITDVCCLGIEIFERTDLGSVYEFRLTLAVTGKRLFPTTVISTGGAVDAAASATGLQAIVNFVAATAATIQKEAAVVQAAVSTAVGWYQTAVSVVNDVKGIAGAVSTLAGNFGRLFGGANNGFAGANPQASPSATAADLLAAAVVSRAAVTATGAALQLVAGGADSSTAIDSAVQAIKQAATENPSSAVALTAAVTTLQTAAANPSDNSTLLGAAIQAFLAVAVATANDPADAVRLAGTLAQYQPVVTTNPSVVGQAMATMQTAMGALLRRCALAQLATTLTTYQPSSQGDANTILQQAVSLIDAEITVAGDAGDDETYQALRSLAQAVVADLTTRGANVAPISSFTFSASLPALALANRIYRDASRADGLVQQVNPIHPAFLPTTFQALAT